MKVIHMGPIEKIMEKIVKQCSKPTGTFGKVVARSMNYGHSKVTQWGLSHVSINKHDTILDVGCGGGKTVNTLAKTARQGKVYGIDYSEDCVKVAGKTNKKLIDTGRVKILRASVESLPFPDDLFALVTVVETYYFFPDLINNLEEICRVLKPGGSVILINEAYRHDKFEKRNAKWARMGDFTYHLPEEFKQFLGDAGYSSIQIDVLESKNWITTIGVEKRIR
jgi:SAM-dependent methyltransferase